MLAILLYKKNSLPNLCLPTATQRLKESIGAVVFCYIYCLIVNARSAVNFWQTNDDDGDAYNVLFTWFVTINFSTYKLRIVYGYMHAL